MFKYSNKKILLTFFGILLLAISFRFSTILSFPDSSILLQKETLVPLQPKETLTQKIFINRNNLSSFDFLFRTPGPKSGDKIEVTIAEDDCQTPLRQGNIQEAFLNSKNLYTVSFSSIPNSQNKTYCLKVLFVPQKNSSKNIRLFAMTDKSHSFALTNSITKVSYPEQTLSIRPNYKNNNWLTDFSKLNQRISQYKPYFLKNTFLSIVIIGFLLASILVIVLLISC
jgi:hypothetical protein